MSSLSLFVTVHAEF
uniref:Uncharacterized protein n=1 Tax=Anguilla anguilla TaxID=7936 RepID=A0A0E9S451_ANGAN